MRWRALFPVVVVCLSGCKTSVTTGSIAKEETDKENLQGIWVADAYERDGKPVGNAVLRRTRLDIEDDVIELIETAEVGEIVTFKLDEDANPKRIDMRLTKGAGTGRVSPGIYRLDGDFLRICWAAPGQPRPTAFTTLNGMGVACLSLHRLGESN